MTDLSVVPECEDSPSEDNRHAIPILWLPNARLTHGNQTYGVKWMCQACGIEGPGRFGPARDLVKLTQDAHVAFYMVEQADPELQCEYLANPQVGADDEAEQVAALNQDLETRSG